MKRFFLLISLLVSLILSVPEIVLAGSCSGELYVCANCCKNPDTHQSYDCYKCSSSGSTAVTCGPGTHACIGSCFSGGSCCCDNGTNLPDDDPGYTARPKCPTLLKPDDTGKTPIYASNVSTPISFSWRYNGGWGKRTNDKQYIYGILDITRRIMGFDGSWVKQTVARFSDSNYDGYLANTYTWHPPLHYRYIAAYDNVDYLYSSGDWSLQFSSDPSQMLDGSVSMTNIKGATAEREISLFGEGGFVVRYVARPFGGKMKVSIDGAEAGIIDQEANRDKCGWQVEWQSPELSQGIHHVKLYHGAWNSFSSIDALKIGDTIYDIGYGKWGPIDFHGSHVNTWYPVRDQSSTKNAYGQNWIRGLYPSAPATFDFEGTSFSIIHMMLPYGLYRDSEGAWRTRQPGYLDVTIDDGTPIRISQGLPGTNAQIQSFYFPAESTYWEYNQEWQSPMLSKGTHTITLEHVDDRFNKYVNVDAIITDDVAGGLTTEGTYTWTANSKDYHTMSSINCTVRDLVISLDTTSTPSATPSAWYQLVGGSAAAKGGDISVTVPDTAGADNNQRVLSGLAGSSDTTSTGFLMAGTGHEVNIPHYLGVTGRTWAVSDGSYYTPPIENFTYLKRLFELPLVPTESFYQREGLEAVLPVEGSTDGWTTGGLTTIKDDTYDEGNTYVYYHTGDLTVENPLTIADGSKRVIFVKGNVTINQNIQVATGSFLSIIATGNLTIGGNVTKAQGVYIVDKTITVEDNADATVTGLNRQFVGQGTFVGWQGINLNRDLQDTNSTNPAEQFIYRPDFLINAPSLYKRFGIQWQEVAPIDPATLGQ